MLKLHSFLRCDENWCHAGTVQTRLYLYLMACPWGRGYSTWCGCLVMAEKIDPEKVSDMR